MTIVELSTQQTMRSVDPLVTVVIPAYNAEQVIATTLTSVIHQTYQNLEILVVDDGSCDRTAEIVTGFTQKDSRVRLIQQTNGGVAAARNTGISAAQGEFIAPLDADDVWYPSNLQRQVDCLLNSPAQAGLAYSWSIDIDAADRPTGVVRASRIEGEVYTTLLLHDFIANASSVMLRRSCLEEIGGYNTSLKQRQGQGSEDWDIYLRMAERYEFRVVPEFLVGYRRLPDSMSTDFSQMVRSRQLVWQDIHKKYPKLPDIIKRLSNSSYYLYIAWQCYEAGQRENLFRWVAQAMRTAPLTVCLRPSVWKLCLKGALMESQADDECQASPSETASDSQDGADIGSNVTSKVLAEIFLHRVVSPVLGNLRRWRAAAAQPPNTVNQRLENPCTTSN